MDYEKLYKILFNGMTDAVRAIEREDYNDARFALIRAQQDAEELFITEGEDEDGEDGGENLLPPLPPGFGLRVVK